MAFDWLKSPLEQKRFQKMAKRKIDDVLYFSEVVDPVMRPLLTKLRQAKPTKAELPQFIIDFMSNIENLPPLASSEHEAPPLAPSENEAKNSSIKENSIAEPLGMEKDSAETETVQDLVGLLLPPNFSPLSTLKSVGDHFSISYSKRALEAWVKQPSPCCAAASAAGAWNASMGFTRTDDRAQSHLTMVPVFSNLLQDQADSIRGRFERLLGAPLQPLLNALEEKLGEEGKTLGGKGDAFASRKHVLKVVRLIVEGYVQERTALKLALKQEATNQEEVSDEKAVMESEVAMTESEMMGDVFDRMGELFEEEKKKLEAKKAAAEEGEEIDEDFEEDDEDDDEEGAGSREEEELEDKVEEGGGGADDIPSLTSVKKRTVKKKGKKSKKKNNGVWNWKKELLDWLHKVGGLEKINALRPSTAPFGNWGVMGALRSLNDMRSDLDVVATLLMGKKSVKSSSATATMSARGVPPYVGLSRDDDEDAITNQWNALRSAFLRPDSCLLFHLKNHYALIFALREWEEPMKEEGEVSIEDDGTSVESPLPGKRRHVVVRQLLTSRRGQRPSAWVDFSEARQTMLNWDGYKIMVTSRLA